MPSANEDSDFQTPSDLQRRLLNAEEARFRGEHDWLEVDARELPADQRPQFARMLSRLQLLQQAAARQTSRSAAAEAPAGSAERSSTEAGETLDFRRSTDAGCVPEPPGQAEADGRGFPDAVSSAGTADAATADGPGRLGKYVCERLLGSGGFGAVFEARDTILNRPVALKVPRVETILSYAARHRFLREARACATLQHPNIVSVYETIESPEAAIVYELCDGGTLRDLASDESPSLTEEQIIRLMIALASGLQHAHQRGILHRDIKPSNVLLCSANEDSSVAVIELGGRELIPKLTDFGLAKIIEDHDEDTHTGTIMGTPGFMSPEQAEARRGDIGTHSDVFSLGALFYWLLTGQRPWQGQTGSTWPGAWQRDLLIPPRKLNSQVSRELNLICLKCLEPQVEDRYESALHLLDDLTALHAGEPISVKAPGPMELLRRARRRHPLFLTSTLMGLLLLLLAVVMEWNHRSAQNALVGRLNTLNDELSDTVQDLNTALNRAEHSDAVRAGLLYESDMQLAEQSKRDGDLPTVRKILARHIPDRGQPDLRGVEWLLLWNETHMGSRHLIRLNASIYDIERSPDGHTIAVVGADAVIRMYAIPDWTPVARIATEQIEINSITFSPDGSIVATAGDDGTVRLWDHQHAQQILSVTTASPKAFGVVFHPDGSRFYTCGNGPVLEEWQTAGGTRSATMLGHKDSIDAIDVSADGRFLYTAGADQRRGIHDLQTQTLVSLTPVREDQRIASVTALPGPSEHWFLTGTIQGRTSDRAVLQLENATSGARRQVAEFADGVQVVALHPSQPLAVCGLRNGEITIVDVDDPETGGRDRIRYRWLAHQARIYGISWTPDGDVISASSNGQVSLWPAEQFRQSVGAELALDSPLGPIQPDSLCWSSSGRWLLWNTVRGELVVTDVDHRESRTVMDGLSPDDRISLSPDERHVLVWSNTSSLRMYTLRMDLSVAPPEVVQTIRPTPLWSVADGSQPTEVTSVCWLKNGHIVLIRRRSRTLAELRELNSGTLVRAFEASGQDLTDNLCAELSGDERYLFLGEGDAIMGIELDTGRRWEVGRHESTVSALAWCSDSPEGTEPRLISGGADRTMRYWEPFQLRQIEVVHGHLAGVHRLAIGFNRRSVISVSQQNHVAIWSLQSGMPLRKNWDRELAESFDNSIVSPLGVAAASPRAWRVDRVFSLSRLPHEDF